MRVIAPVVDSDLPAALVLLLRYCGECGYTGTAARKSKADATRIVRYSYPEAVDNQTECSDSCLGLTATGGSGEHAKEQT